MGRIRDFLIEHFKHFNAAAVVDAAQAYRDLLDSGGKMFLAMAGAMSTAELGKSLAEMIRRDKVHAISCTGANLEEDLYNLVANTRYKRIPNYRELTPAQEQELFEQGFNRVTDTCIPEEEAMRLIESYFIELWKAQDKAGQPLLPHEYVYKLLLSGKLKKHYDINPKDSWVLAAAEKNLPLFVPGWEDSTLGNMFVALYLKKGLSGLSAVKSGLHYMAELAKWYQSECRKNPIGFFQIGGGIAGDFPICVVPMLSQDMKQDIPRWAYFCQISDSTTSYGSYSGAVPNEKITWGKLAANTPRFIIESDATIVAPLIFAYVLDW